ncbi:MAG: hypothetical protein DI538_26005 [Azospira oryzae]|nr:MAG: hypothetical protein DI538_26005 [Azospira oryzae]
MNKVEYFRRTAFGKTDAKPTSVNLKGSSKYLYKAEVKDGKEFIENQIIRLPEKIRHHGF